MFYALDAFLVEPKLCNTVYDIQGFDIFDANLKYKATFGRNKPASQSQGKHILFGAHKPEHAT